MLVDIARHAAKAYAKEGQDPAIVLARIREMFEAEWSAPTDIPSDLSNLQKHPTREWNHCSLGLMRVLFVFCFMLAASQYAATADSGSAALAFGRRAEGVLRSYDNRVQAEASRHSSTAAARSRFGLCGVLHLAFAAATSAFMPRCPTAVTIAFCIASRYGAFFSPVAGGRPHYGVFAADVITRGK